MVEKQLDDASGAVVVRFRLPAEVVAETAFVVGDFNGWSTSSDAMQREDGAFVADIRLEPGRAYRFRYLLDGQRWENDWAADTYEPNEFGGDDSVIDLTDSTIAPSPTRSKPRAARRVKKSEGVS
jgi:1,4-alpha-glucan branching enzyme